MRLIDADALTDSLDSLCDTVCQYSKVQRSVMCGACPLGGAFDVVDNAPTVSPDMAQVLAYECGKAERKRGKWEMRPDPDSEGEYGVCSECGHGADFGSFVQVYDFCPWCGADMRGENNG